MPWGGPPVMRACGPLWSRSSTGCACRTAGCTGTILVDAASYRGMVEDTLLNRLKAEKLERRIRELVDECNSLQQRLEASDISR